jgi:broad specificity phosphatase PhoE
VIPACGEARRLLLVRHGLPDYRMGKRGDEPPGPVLSEIGRDQGRQTVPILARYHPAAVYSSPLSRAMQTAEIIGRSLGLRIRIDAELSEWHRTESLYEVSQRSGRWLRRWLAGEERCAVVVGHASPLLALLREGLYLPHARWWRSGDPRRLVLDTCDRFEFSMGSVFELLFEPRGVTARCLHHPTPRISYFRDGQPVGAFPRPVMHGEGRFVERRNIAALVGYRHGVAGREPLLRLSAAPQLRKGD